jgi:benzylsuccinate CoA-transferase BbsE subunit
MPDPADTAPALDDVRVLDLTGEPGMYCAKLLAELGADVIKIERPGGDPARRIGPFYQDKAHPNKSLYFFGLNSSKRSITLDITTADGQVLFKRLLPKADVVVETFQPGHLDSFGLGYADLCGVKPDIILCSITGFGQWGPHSQYQAPDIVPVAMSGIMYIAGYPDIAPSYAYGNQSHYCGSIQAAAGILMALLHRDATGEGQQVEVSRQEALSINQETAMQYWDVRHELRRRMGWERRMPAMGLHECKDGYVVMMVGVPGFGAPWPTLVEWMVEEGKAEDLQELQWQEILREINMQLMTQLFAPEADPELVATWKDRLAHIDEVLLNFLAGHTKRELYEEGQRRGLLIAPANDPKDIFENPQLNYRRWFTPLEHSDLGTAITYPGPPYRLSETPWRIQRPAPRVGEHNEEIYSGELGISKEQLAVLSAARVI